VAGPDAAGAGFERGETSGARWVVESELAGPLRALALWDPAVRARHFAATPAARGRARTALVPLADGRSLHLRRVLHGGRLAPLWGDRLLSLARPLRELEVTAALRARGAPVPRPLLVVGWRRAPFWSALYGTLHERAAQDGFGFLASGPPPLRLAAAIDAVARAVRRFHDAGGRHADLHLGNLLLRERDGACEALLIDLDRAQAGAPPDAPRRMAELMRLYRSLVKRGVADAVGARGCARFLAVYCDGDRALRRALWARLPAERRRLARHAASWALFGKS
jgi:3-deoxy-D-manno-octulosonic acid kinase